MCGSCGVRALFSVAILTFACIFTASAQSKIFWTDNSPGAGIHAINRDGTGDVYLFHASDLVYSNLGPWLANITADSVNQKIYWVDDYGGLGRIERSDFDGSNRETVFNIGTYSPGDVIVDPENEHIYWISNEHGIRRQNYDGTNNTTLVGPALCEPRGIALFLWGDLLFWIGPSGIMRSNTDGTHLRPIVTDPGMYPWDVAVDPVAQRIYWTTLGSGLGQGSIRSAKFDGTDIRIHLTSLHEPCAITVDAEGRLLYWTELRAGLWRSEMDGTNAELIYYLEAPLGIALDTGSVEPALPSAGAIGLLFSTVILGLLAACKASKNHAAFKPGA